MSHTLSLGDQRRLFTELLCDFTLWIVRESGLGVRVAFDEGRVFSPRAARLGVQRVIVEDAVHVRGSYHHTGRAIDLLVYADLDGDGAKDDYLADGSHPLWRTLARNWEERHLLCTAGLRWNDANHFSFGGEGNRREPL